MFAGAAREAVFSKPEVIRRVRQDFIPVSLKAGLVNRPPDNEEGRLYREIARSQPLPQGICVVNPAGKVLEWVVSFNGDQEVIAFLDHSLKRYHEYPDASKPVAAERFMHFPNRKLDDVMDNGEALPVAERHAAGTHCPATPPIPEGAIEASLVGRAFDKEGQPRPDQLSQEYYVEERFIVPPRVTGKLAELLSVKEKQEVAFPEALFRPFVAHAYLGVLDVAPIFNPGPSKGELLTCEFSAKRVAGSEGLWRITGKSDTSHDDRMCNATPGDLHRVQLDWDGFVLVDSGQVTEIVVSAKGRERLKFGTERNLAKSDVSYLPSGHTIDLDSRVRYGIVAEVKAGQPPRSQNGDRLPTGTR